MGETHPSPATWSKIVAAIARFSPAPAVALAQAVGVPSPFPPPAPVDERALEAALFRMADALDVAPRRVRAAVRDLARAAAQAHAGLADLERAAAEPEASTDAPPLRS